MPAPRHRAPAGRYHGRPGWGDPAAERRARFLRAGLAVLTGLGFAVVVVTYVHQAQPTVVSDVLGFEVLDDSSVRVDFEVRKPAGQEALCVLRARDDQGSQVGLAEILIPGSDPDTSTRSYTLRTTARPVTGEVVGCELSATLQRPRPTG